MARLDELAQGIADVLKATVVPEPFPIDLRNETPAAATVFVRAIVYECVRRAVPLTKVAICPELGADLLRQHGASPGYYEGVAIVYDQRLQDRIELYRFHDEQA